MKRTYSIILLLTFLVGTLQPILPMIEYQLFEGSIIELLSSKADNSEESCTMVRCLVDTDCLCCGEDEDLQLLDTDYYPLALKITTIPEPHAFLSSSRLFLPVVNNATGPTFLPNPPPPRFS
ncbi:hypothetical protein NC796_06390 [Aliifodinibius sp. S!AR15-10]|uniref:hypothetical protein n=1 Tax=Aliifodinibius sp. S!AR15-10 TaxID=2950437 RepID=UPI00285ACC5E|nr:hypothetical protein [Aliifodinibius sp. S!AR15-10]MDR8390756.1 hypothetical protein [Aliifodinibius sp. S!AR15-10]